MAPKTYAAWRRSLIATRADGTAFKAHVCKDGCLHADDGSLDVFVRDGSRERHDVPRFAWVRADRERTVRVTTPCPPQPKPCSRIPHVPRGSYLVYSFNEKRPRYRVTRSYGRAKAHAALLGGGSIDKRDRSGELVPIATVFDSDPDNIRKDC